MLEEMGGPEKFGRAIAKDWDNLEGHSRVLMTGKAIQLIEAEDKAKARQQEIEYLGQQQERAILLEHSLYLLETDESFRTKLIEVARKRELLPETRLLEVE